MRLIHFTADDGWEAVVFTDGEERARDFVRAADTQRPGFKIATDGYFSEPTAFYPGDGDLLVKESDT